MKKWLLALVCLCGTMRCEALLSPLNQSLQEIQSIVHSDELQKYLPQEESVVEMRRVDKGYLLRTQRWQLLVEIQFIPTTRPGRQDYTLIFHQPTSLPS